MPTTATVEFALLPYRFVMSVGPGLLQGRLRGWLAREFRGSCGRGGGGGLAVSLCGRGRGLSKALAVS